jgi:general secretion pathway protein D
MRESGSSRATISAHSESVSIQERAKEGIEALKLERRHIASVEAAKALLARNDDGQAETIVRAVLQENPQQSHARELISQINSRLVTP